MLAATPAPEAADTDKLRRIFKNVRKRLRQLREILAAGTIPDTKKVNKICFIANLLLPLPEQPAFAEAIGWIGCPTVPATKKPYRLVGLLDLV